MLRATIRTQLRAGLADDANVMLDAEIDGVIDLAIIEYSRVSPLIVETAVTTVAGTLTYTPPSGTLEIYSITNDAGGDVTFTRFNQQYRLTTDPDGAVLTLLSGALHAEASTAWPSIPDHHLPIVLDLATATILERLADDIARRPAVRDGQTSEDWGKSAEILLARARDCRVRATSSFGDTVSLVYVG